MTDKIFISIASYRDPELLPTIRDCIKRADNPDDLVFAIAWQHSKEDEWDTLEEYKDDPKYIECSVKYKTLYKALIPNDLDIFRPLLSLIKPCR